MSHKKKLYFPSIDGLRLFASVNIVLFHFQASGGMLDLGGSPGWLFRILKGPAFHASLFFLLGGFIFAIKYLPHAEHFSSRKFLISRLKDLYPLHFVATLAMIPLLFLAGGFVLSGPAEVGKFLYTIFVQFSMLWAVVPIPGSSFTLNTPSWALSAFFLCYVLFKPLLGVVNRFSSKRTVFLALVGCFIPMTLASVVYIVRGCPDEIYTFLHVFAPLRLFEFVMGMLIAQLFILRAAQREEKPGLTANSWVNDAIILALFAIIYLVVPAQPEAHPIQRWVGYHLIQPALYCGLLYRFARGNGVIAWVFARKPVRNLGRSSFYPYLIHIPLMSWLCYVLEHFFGYNTFLHSWVNVTVFVALLYGISMLYVTRVRKRAPAKVLKGEW